MKLKDISEEGTEKRKVSKSKNVAGMKDNE